MDILIIHGNYPAQFRHLCAGFAANPTNNVVFLTGRADATKEPIPGVDIATFQTHRAVHPHTHTYLQATEEAVLQGQAVIRSIDQLIQGGFEPRLVLFHAGNGLGLFLRDILPQAVTVGYFEWWFQPETTQHLVETFDINMQLQSGLRNLPVLQELNRCHSGVTPTQWQKKQFPEEYQNKLNVIFDGIDSSFFHPAIDDIDQQTLSIKNRDSGELFEFATNQTILSYATRGMEPLRGFPEFMRTLPEAFAAIPNLQVVIAGADRCAYSYPAPGHQGSWKNHLLEELEGKVPEGRIHFTGLLNYPDYRALLWRSDLHCYFTFPYVTSWSLFEASACGARLLASRNQATEGIAAADSVHWVDLDQADQIGAAIVEQLQQPRTERTRSRLLPGFDLKGCLKQWQSLLNRLLQSN